MVNTVGPVEVPQIVASAGQHSGEAANSALGYKIALIRLALQKSHSRSPSHAAVRGECRQRDPAKHARVLTAELLLGAGRERVPLRRGDAEGVSGRFRTSVAVAPSWRERAAKL